MINLMLLCVTFVEIRASDRNYVLVYELCSPKRSSPVFDLFSTQKCVFSKKTVFTTWWSTIWWAIPHQLSVTALDYWFI